MEFWGVEVPSGRPLTCRPGVDSYVHVSQAALGEHKNVKGNDRVVLKVKVGTNEVVLGSLAPGKCEQTTLDLIFERDFVLSHNSSGSVYFCGYKTDAVRDYDSLPSSEDDDTSDEDEDELVAQPAKENGKLGLKAGKATVPATNLAAKIPAAKPETPAADSKPKAKPLVAEKVKVTKEKSSEDDDDDDDDEDEEDQDSDEDDDMMGSDSDDDEDLESDEEDKSVSESGSEDDQPKVAGKKRPAPALQVPSAGKKGKTETPGKGELKTPSVPASTPKQQQQQQQSGKKDASGKKKTPGKENSSTPASGKKLGQFFCQPCSKNFNSESALSQHKTAKHK